MPDEIKLPSGVADKFEIVQQPPGDTLYFGKEIGNVTFSKITETQCVKLIKMNSPYIRVKEDKAKTTVKESSKTV